MKQPFLVTVIILIFSMSISAQTQTARRLAPSTFVGLGSTNDGEVRWCPDCTPNTVPCTGSGTGADAYRINGAWVCRSVVAATSGTVTTTGTPASPQLAKFSGATSITTATATDVSTPVQCSDAGSTDSYACSLAPALASYVAGTHLRFKANTANTGAASINFNSLGAKTIVKVSSGITTALADNDIRAGQWVDLVYDGTNMQMQSTLGNASELTNSAGTNVVPKSNGTNLVASQISDNGTDVTIAGGTSINASASIGNISNSTVTVGGQNPSGFSANQNTTIIGDWTGIGNGTTLTVNDAAQTISSNAAAQWTVGSGIFPFSAGTANIGSTGVPFASSFIGNAANNSSQITGTFTGNRIATLPDATGTIQLVGAANTGTILPVDMSNGVLSTATGTVYASPGTTAGLTNATESAVSFPVTRAGTIRNLYVRTGGTAKVNTPTTVITVRKNGVDTTLTVTMTQTVTTTSSDTTHSFTVVAGDLITVSFVTTGAAGVSTSIAGVSFEVD